MENNSDLKTEWCLLQNQYDSYEKCSLTIKLICLCVISLLLSQTSSLLLLVGITAIFWLQDAIWKTFQSRIDERLLFIETAIHTKNGDNTDIQGTERITAFQFNKNFADTRPSFIGLLINYIKQAIRPTIAYPYVAIILLVLLNTL